MAERGGSDGRARIRQLLEFIREINSIRHPVHRTIPYPSFPTPIWWSELPSSLSVIAQRPDEDGGGDDVLEVGRPNLEPAPTPPARLLSWLHAGWDAANHANASWAIERTGPDGELERLSEDDQLALLEWQDLRSEWVARTLPDLQAVELFNRLWAIHSQFERESEGIDLVVADGHISWERGDLVIQHPVLIQPVDLEFDAGLPRFRVVMSERPVEFADQVFRPDAKATPNATLPVDLARVGQLRASAAAEGIGPLDGLGTDDFLTRLATSLDSNGRVVATPHRPRGAPGPNLTVFRDPVLFLRPRAAGFARAIDDALESMATRTFDELPESLLALAGVPHAEKVELDTLDLDPWILPDEQEALLTKPANREQLHVLRALARHHNVLVQGPPGTGKTHTIANIVGHLVAEGKTVLVTAQTTKALRVLREKVAEPLRPLAVSVLDRDSASTAELTESATAISARLSGPPPDTREIERLGRKREDLVARLKTLRDELLRLVSSEHMPISVGGWNGTPAEAARSLVERAGDDGWIPGPTAGEASPLSRDEVRSLYRTNGTLSDADLQEIGSGPPAPSAVWRPEEFGELLRSEREATAIADTGVQYWRNARRTARDIDGFRRIALATFPRFAAAAPWELDAIHDGWSQGGSRGAWEALVADLDQFVAAARDSDAAAKLYGPQIGGRWTGRADELLGHFQALRDHVASGGKLSGLMFRATRRDWTDVLDSCATLGRRPASPEEFAALATIPAMEITFRQVGIRWSLLMAGHGLLAPSDAIEASDYAAGIRWALDAATTELEPLARRAQAMGLDLLALCSVEAQSPRAAAEWTAFATAAVARLPAALDGELARMTLAAATEARSAMKSELQGYSRSPTARAIIGAIEANDEDAYDAAYRQLVSLAERTPAAKLRTELLARMEGRAPAWPIEIGERRGLHGAATPPGDVHLAWSWRLLAQRLEDVASDDAAPVLARIQEERRQLQEVTLHLAELRAWRALHQRTTPQAQQALRGYAVSVRMQRKGTGQRDKRLQSGSRDAMKYAREAVPVWIAPLYRVAETFDAKRAKFDVVIIDEASQLDVTGLLAWFFGKQVIVVGDDQQVSPTAVGVPGAQLSALIAQYISGIPSQNLYDTQSSVYDLAQTVFSGVVKLREHFRCVPDIIGFSNELSYNWDILPLREEASAKVRPAVISEFVDNGERGEDRKTNLPEALRVASLLIAAYEQPEYESLTFGVISLLGSTSEQPALIERFVRNNLSPEAMIRARMLFGTPPEFQGDERDVIFLSMVDGPREDGLPLRLRGVDTLDFKKRYNVAVSRAKDQLWVVSSLKADRDLKLDDLRRRILDFAADPSGQRRKNAELKRKAQSGFEVDVAQRLSDRGYEVVPQHSAGPYFIDLLVRVDQRSLAVECDGDKYHNAHADQIRRDLDRQALLERLGYTFHRIRSSQFYRDKEATMERLFRRLEAEGIAPSPPTTVEADAAPPRASDLVERVRLRAAEIREIWKQGRTLLDRPPSQRSSAAMPVQGSAATGTNGAARGNDWDRAPVMVTPEVAAAGSDPEAAGTAVGSTSDAPAAAGRTGAVAPAIREYIDRLLDPRKRAYAQTIEDAIIQGRPWPSAPANTPADLARSVVERMRALTGAAPASDSLSGSDAPLPEQRPPTPIRPEVAGAFVRYQEASLDRFPAGESLSEETNANLFPMFLEVARVEGPVHFELILARLRDRYGIGRAREATQRRVLRAIEALGASGRVALTRRDAGSDLFVSIPGAPVSPRSPGMNGLRKSDHIAGAEFQAGVMAVLGRRGSETVTVVEDVSRAFGFQRTSAQLSDAIQGAIEALVVDGTLTRRGSFVSKAG